MHRPDLRGGAPLRSIELIALMGVLLPGGASAAPEIPGTPFPSPPIAEKSWRQHPAVVAIRSIVASNEAAIASGALRRDAKRVCGEDSSGSGVDERPFASDRVVFRDSTGRIRKYVASEGTDDSAYTVEHHFDARGRLRFVFARAGAANDAVVEHRLYFDEAGRLLWKDRQETGPGYTFLDDFPEGHISRDAEKAWNDPSGCPR